MSTGRMNLFDIVAIKNGPNKTYSIVGYINPHRIRWIGHIARMDQERMVKRKTEWRPPAVRRTGRMR